MGAVRLVSSLMKIQSCHHQYRLATVKHMYLYVHGMIMIYTNAAKPDIFLYACMHSKKPLSHNYMSSFIVIYFCMK